MAKTGKKRISKRRVVAVAFPAITETELAVLDGIRDAATSANWEILVLTGGFEAILRELAELKEISGAIGDFVSDTWLDTLRGHGVKVVQLAHASHVKTVPDVSPDYREMGCGAAHSLWSNGAEAFAFIGAPGQYASQQLFEGFENALCGKNRSPLRSGCVALAQIREFLRPLPRPLGLFAASDRLARFAVLAARELGWRIPEELAVIGVGNVRLESFYAGIPLSSYEVPGRELGRLAARCLSQQFDHEQKIAVPPARPLGVLHERKSSLRSPTGLERALSYARSNLDQPLQVFDLCRIAGMSRRSLENAMRSAYELSPSLLLQKLRRERAETLLRSTQMSIQSIAQACGYLEPSVFSSAFRRWTKVSPSDYRSGSTPRA